MQTTKQSLFFCCLALLLLSGCGSQNSANPPAANSSAIAGRWDEEVGPKGSSWLWKMELLTDGSAVINGKTGGTWKAENGRFYLVGPPDAPYYSAAFDCTVSGATLTLTQESGTSLIYKKR